jgi:hypothetical protein
MIIFLILVKGELKKQDFDIRKEAGGRSYSVVKVQCTVPVTRNFLEVHLFWAGKGTCCVPSQGHYGPAISALSATLISILFNSKPKFLLRELLKITPSGAYAY